MYGRWGETFEKMAGIFWGRNEKAVFVKKGEPPPSSRAGRAGRAEQSRAEQMNEGMKEGRVERTRAEQKEGRADGTFEKINSEKKESRSRAEQSRKCRAEQRAEQDRAALHLFSIGNYFHRSLPSESNIKPKIII